jgi:hypothetical protein
MAMGKVRDKSKEAFWRRTVRWQRQSGLTVRAFCREHALHETAFYFWRRELARREADDRRSVTLLPVRLATSSVERAAPTQRRSAAFVAVRLAEEAPAGGRIEIVLSGGRRVHVAAPVDRQALADVLAVLSEVGTRSGEAAAC